MKLIITDSQYNKIISEASFKYSDLCNSFGNLGQFCKKVQKILNDRYIRAVKIPSITNLEKNQDDEITQDTQIENKKGSTIKGLSIDFFRKVISDSGEFNVVELVPNNNEYEKRIKKLNDFKDILEKHNSCPEMVKSIENDLNRLPSKKLKMVVDDSGHYSLLNRLDSHYTAKSYLLTKLISSEVDESKLNTISDSKIIEILSYVMQDKFVSETAEFLKDLLSKDEEFKSYLFSALKTSKEEGEKAENYVFAALRNKYGTDNVISFSEDFGFVDYFGVDGILIDEHGNAHPIQVSSNSPKSEPKLFKFSSESCKPIGFAKQGKKITIYSRHI